jgi:hypothetical protein
VDESISVELLAAHRDLLPLLQKWFETEWPSYYGPNGPGHAELDLRAFANRGNLPVGVVAFKNGGACGVAALKAESIASHRQLSRLGGCGAGCSFLARPWDRGAPP